MASRNDITGDKIRTKGVLSKQGENNFDAIFRKKEPLCDICGKVLDATKECAWTSCPLGWDEKRLDIIGQNGPTGEHYEEEK